MENTSNNHTRTVTATKPLGAEGLLYGAEGKGLKNSVSNYTKEESITFWTSCDKLCQLGQNLRSKYWQSFQGHTLDGISSRFVGNFKNQLSNNPHWRAPLSPPMRGLQSMCFKTHWIKGWHCRWKRSIWFDSGSYVTNGGIYIKERKGRLSYNRYLSCACANKKSEYQLEYI